MEKKIIRLLEFAFAAKSCWDSWIYMIGGLWTGAALVMIFYLFTETLLGTWITFLLLEIVATLIIIAFKTIQYEKRMRLEQEFLNEITKEDKFEIPHIITSEHR